jgi:hypothetical protein
MFGMASPPKSEQKVHYVPEWAAHRHMRQVDVVDALEGLVDKSTVSRWWGGALPEKKHLQALQDLFELDEPAALFRHPDDDWMRRFLRARSEDERFRIRQMLEAAFPNAKAS